MDRQPQASAGNGAGGPRPQVAAAGTATRPRDARQLRLGRSFAQVVAVLMRDRNFRQMRLADLEWLVLPPLMAGQFRLAQMPAPPPKGEKPAGEGKDQAGAGPGVLVPIAVALWARVSANTDKALQGNLDKQARLHPADWASGDNIWLIAVAGDKRAIPKFIEQLYLAEFKGKLVKMRMRGADGKAVVRTMGPSDPKPAAKPAGRS